MRSTLQALSLALIPSLLLTVSAPAVGQQQPFASVTGWKGTVTLSVKGHHSDLKKESMWAVEHLMVFHITLDHKWIGATLMEDEDGRATIDGFDPAVYAAPSDRQPSNPTGEESDFERRLESHPKSVEIRQKLKQRAITEQQAAAAMLELRKSLLQANADQEEAKEEDWETRELNRHPRVVELTKRYERREITAQQYMSGVREVALQLSSRRDTARKSAQAAQETKVSQARADYEANLRVWQVSPERSCRVAGKVRDSGTGKTVRGAEEDDGLPVSPYRWTNEGASETDDVLDCAYLAVDQRKREYSLVLRKFACVDTRMTRQIGSEPPVLQSKACEYLGDTKPDELEVHVKAIPLPTGGTTLSGSRTLPPQYSAPKGAVFTLSWKLEPLSR
jgi:hypothetical protein